MQYGKNRPAVYLAFEARLAGRLLSYRRLRKQSSLNFDVEQEQIFIDTFFGGIEQIRLAGPELVLGKLFDEIGFNAIKDEMFRHLVLTRLVYPVSKLKTVDYLPRHQGVELDIDKVYPLGLFSEFINQLIIIIIINVFFWFFFFVNSC